MWHESPSGALNAAKFLTLAAVELDENRELHEAAAQAHRDNLGEDFEHESPLDDHAPPLS